MEKINILAIGEQGSGKTTKLLEIAKEKNLKVLMTFFFTDDVPLDYLIKNRKDYDTLLLDVFNKNDLLILLGVQAITGYNLLLETNDKLNVEHLPFEVVEVKKP